MSLLLMRDINSLRRLAVRRSMSGRLGPKKSKGIGTARLLRGDQVIEVRPVPQTELFQPFRAGLAVPSGGRLAGRRRGSISSLTHYQSSRVLIVWKMSPCLKATPASKYQVHSSNGQALRGFCIQLEVRRKPRRLSVTHANGLPRCRVPSAAGSSFRRHRLQGFHRTSQFQHGPGCRGSPCRTLQRSCAHSRPGSGEPTKPAPARIRATLDLSCRPRSSLRVHSARCS